MLWLNKISRIPILPDLLYLASDLKIILGTINGKMNVSKGFYEVFSFIQFLEQNEYSFTCIMIKYLNALRRNMSMWKVIINRTDTHTDRQTDSIP